MRKNKIGFRIGLVILIAFVVVILSLGLAIDRMFTNFYNAEMRTEVEELTAHFTAMSQSPESLSEDTLLQFADFSNVSIVFVGEQGNVLAHSGPYDLLDRSFIKPQDLQVLFAGKAVELEHLAADGDRYFVAARPVREVAGANFGAAAFFLALGITWILAGLLSRPLVQIQAATEE
ncbi:hypothetical protein [Paenibacillus macerans]|uniref:hypothetical protein n=1 Tax=Paenibacillus macerans TaxID=44252 RepID=UPI003D30F776